MNSDDQTRALIAVTLETAVPLWVERLKRLPWRDVNARRDDLVAMIAAHGDDILYKAKRKGDSAKAFNALAEAVAILAFAEGGVKAFGLHFVAEHPEIVRNRPKTGQ